MSAPLPPTTIRVAAVAAVLLAAAAAGQPPDGVERTPRIASEWWRVASNPDLGVLGSDALGNLAQL